MTKNQRRDLYYAAMFEIVGFGLSGDGICWAIDKVAREVTQEILFLSDFPELEDQKPIPPYNFAYWFPAGKCKKQRLECLSKAIDLCEKR